MLGAKQPFRKNRVREWEMKRTQFFVRFAPYFKNASFTGRW